MTIKALVFDFDGLILDTETPEYQAWQDVYQQYGAHLALSDWLACVGTSQEAFDPVINLKRLAAQELDDQQILHAQRAFFKEKMQQIATMPGVMKTIMDANRLSLKLAIASSSKRDWLDRFLQPLQLQDTFQCICTSDDVEKVKPDPSLYLCAVDRLGVLPEEAIAFEDSLNGLIAAKNAGLFCVAVPNFVTRQLNFTQADEVLDSLEELDLEELLCRFNNRK